MEHPGHVHYEALTDYNTQLQYDCIIINTAVCGVKIVSFIINICGHA